MTDLENNTKVRFVMVETSHSGNIGAAARALKVMGFSSLVLVSPRDFPSAEAEAMASGADDVLANARVVSSLAEALAGCHLAIGASARLRSMEWPVVDGRQMGEQVAREVHSGEVAVVFGRERTGLTNEELAQCHCLMHIPANPAYSSLNVAAAMQIAAYEVRMAMLGAGGEVQISEAEFADDPPATSDEVEGFMQHMEQALREVRFIKPERPTQLMLRLRRLYNRVRLTRNEVNILRGIMAALQGRKY